MKRKNIIVKPIKGSGSRDNAVATILKILTGIIWISGFLAGIICPVDHVVLVNLAQSGSLLAQLLLRFGYASENFTWSSAIIVCFSAFLVGLLPLVIAEIISLLNEIKTTSYVISDIKERSNSAVRADEDTFNDYDDECVTNDRVLESEIEVGQYENNAPFSVKKIRVIPHDGSTAGLKLLISDNDETCEDISADIIFTNVFDEKYTVQGAVFRDFHAERFGLESGETVCEIPIEVYNYIKSVSVKVLSDNMDAAYDVSETKPEREQKTPDRFCPNCGAAIIGGDAIFCAACGTRISE